MIDFILYGTCKVTVNNLAFEHIWQWNTTLFGLILRNSAFAQLAEEQAVYIVSAPAIG